MQRIARLLFTISSGKIVLLHGFIKKTTTIRAKDMSLAKARRIWCVEIIHEQIHRQHFGYFSRR